jgi:hypothetical protein
VLVVVAVEITVGALPLELMVVEMVGLASPMQQLESMVLGVVVVVQTTLVWGLRAGMASLLSKSPTQLLALLLVQQSQPQPPLGFNATAASVTFAPAFTADFLVIAGGGGGGGNRLVVVVAVRVVIGYQESSGGGNRTNFS